MYRHFIITLHVLFPNLVLPALDLLDRGLVTKLVVELLDLDKKDPGVEEVQREREKQGEVADGGVRDVDTAEVQGGSESKQHQQEKLPTPLFLVRSTAQAGNHPRRKRSTGASTPASGPGQAYHVRLDAWNCSCAGFAYSAFPAAEPAQLAPGDSEVPVGPAVSTVARENAEADDPGWSFGGVSLDGTVHGPAGDSVPVCKHLLACLLADRWREALGRYVVERKVTGVELAGYVAEL